MARRITSTNSGPLDEESTDEAALGVSIDPLSADTFSSTWPVMVGTTSGRGAAYSSYARATDPVGDISQTVGIKSGQISFTTNDSDENQFNFSITGTVTASNFWISEGPGPGINGSETIAPDNQVNGAIQAIAVHPADPSIMYVGSVNGGIWKTTNATAASPHWVPLTDNLPSQSIAALELDPTDVTRQTLIAGIGGTSSFGISGPSTGVLRSTDGGATWSQLGTVALGGDDITSVAARGTTLLAGTRGRLLRSTDSGATWTSISDGSHGLPTSLWVSDIAGDPLSSNVLYAAVLGSGGGVFKTTDTGLTWTKIGGDIGIIGSATDKIKLAVHHAATNLDVFATVDNDGILSGVFRSVNGGSFVALDVPTFSQFGSVFGAITADPTNPNIAYVGYGGNGGHYLTRIDASQPTGSQITDLFGGSFGSPHVDIRDMQIDASGNLILSSDGGLFRLPTPTGNTGQWSSIVGDISVFEVHSIAYDHISHSLVVGTQDNGTLLQTPGSSTWSTALGGDGGDVAIDEVSLAASGESILYLSVQMLGAWSRQVYDSANHLVSTTYLSTGPTGNNGHDTTDGNDEDDTTDAPIPDPQFTTPIELNYVEPKRLLVGGAGHIYESLDRGTTLTTIANVGVNGIGFGGGGVMVYGGFQNGGANPDLIYAASGSDVLRRTASDGGFTTTFPGGSTIRGVTDNPTNWAAVFAVDDNQVFKSTNAGATWVDVTANLTTIGGSDFRSIEYVHGTLDDALVVGTGSGVFEARVSALGGPASWTKFGSNLPNVIIYDLEYDAWDNVLVAGTLGRGAWQVDHATTNLGIGNQVPALNAAAGSLSYTKKQAATAIDAVLMVTATDFANLTGATVSISGNFVAGQDMLGFTSQNGITGSYNGTTGVLTLSGASSVANYQTALRSVTYFNNSDIPSTATRAISYQVDDGATGNHASNVVTASVSFPKTANFWVSEGPAPGISGQGSVWPNNQVNGAIQAIAMDPTDPNIMYVASVNGGIWKATNATAASPHWVPLTDNLPSLSMGALEFDPTDATHRTLIAGIDTSNNHGQLGGAFRTADGGATWSQLGIPLGDSSYTNGVFSVAARYCWQVHTSRGCFSVRIPEPVGRQSRTARMACRVQGR